MIFCINEGDYGEKTMSVTDRNIIDITSIEEKDSQKYLVLWISDHLEWGDDVTREHLIILQDKINDYLDFITSDQVSEHYDSANYDTIVIRILFSYPVPLDGTAFLNQANEVIEEAGYRIEWKLDPR